MRLPAIKFQLRPFGCRMFNRSLTLQRGVRAVSVVIVSEAQKLQFQIGRRPEQQPIQTLAS